MNIDIAIGTARRAAKYFLKLKLKERYFGRKNESPSLNFSSSGIRDHEGGHEEFRIFPSTFLLSESYHENFHFSIIPKCHLHSWGRTTRSEDSSAFWFSYITRFFAASLPPRPVCREFTLVLAKTKYTSVPDGVFSLRVTLNRIISRSSYFFNEGKNQWKSHTFDHLNITACAT